MKITTLDRDTVKMVGKQINEALQPLAKMLGLSISCRNGTYSANNVTMKIEVAVIRADGQVVSQESEDFKRYCFRYGMKPEHLGKVIGYAGDKYTIVGARPKSRVSPICVQRSDGKKFKMPADMVRIGLGLATFRSVSNINWDQEESINAAMARAEGQ